ncbi:hypothetical protein Vafri_18983 [Volvox africanus]|uniref:Uncharacterized protein n=1 Tax=Volvox africanus TaxID=51714 RepID=A0A8J4FBN5_9CHLO|nr:hypothetical protein Vafri_18983 [Volvox africanus]
MSRKRMKMRIQRHGAARHYEAGPTDMRMMVRGHLADMLLCNNRQPAEVVLEWVATAYLASASISAWSTYDTEDTTPYSSVPSRFFVTTSFCCWFAAYERHGHGYTRKFVKIIFHMALYICEFKLRDHITAGVGD